jgi:hypothetical protein
LVLEERHAQTDLTAFLPALHLLGVAKVVFLTTTGAPEVLAAVEAGPVLETTLDPVVLAPQIKVMPVVLAVVLGRPQ